ncbi:protein disks lost [Anopheles bellator]|uniref:protein disks lost n=1 Tax=Anopheles bellator TaxID=139047 RepID=UPI002649F903|nr:protein disks lost [Anopheles bellator]
MSEELLRELVAAEVSRPDQFLEWFLRYFKQPESHHHRSIEAFANYFIGFIRAQTEDPAGRSGSTRCETPRKGGPPGGLLRKPSISIEEPASPFDTPDPNLDPSATGSPAPVTTTTARKLFDHSGTGTWRAAEGRKGVDVTATPTRSNRGTPLPSFTSTPIRSGGSTNRSGLDTSGGDGGRRSKTTSPCLGDFVVTTARGHRGGGRRSSVTSNGSETPTSHQQHTPSSALFQNDEFPQLNSSGGGGGGGGGPAPSWSTPKSSGGGRKGRRIIPTTVSRTVSGRTELSSSSFHPDAAGSSLVEVVDEDDAAAGGPLHDPRRMLRSLREEILHDFRVEERARSESARTKPVDPSRTTLDDPPGQSGENAPGEVCPPPQLLTIDFGRVTQRVTIDRLVAIYALLMDLNLVPNVLNELAYLINVVGTERPVTADAGAGPTDTTRGGPEDQLSGILRSPHNGVYFATEVLHRQRMLLALLDCTSLRVVVENEQLTALQPPLTGFLRDVLERKLKLETPGDPSGPATSSSITNVFYQQENDTRDHFPSLKEFGAFNKQRDSFYAILRTWEAEHLNPAWEFEPKLGPKVRSTLDILQHPINMAHLAKLFCAQLIICCNFDNTASELQMALPSIDLTKLSKLRQRLEAPAPFSTQYLFPGGQAFFRDFIVASENHQIFVEQLKVVLIHELLQMNGSSYEVFNVSDEPNPTRSEYVVRPETMSTMRVLAKFIGFVVARPFQYEGYRSTLVDNRQIELRNTLLPPFDVKLVLLRCVVDRKLVITVPWLVQYLGMLDVVTLRLRYYEELFRLLRDVYQATAPCGFAVHRQMFVNAQSKFIVRSCLDWLFDQPNVPEEFFNSRTTFGTLLAVGGGEKPVGTAADQNAPTFNPLLEAVLSAACPFLADFRVSVMPSRVEKTLSRTGRYRHITTRYTGTLAHGQQPPSTPVASDVGDPANLSSTSTGHRSYHQRSQTHGGNAQHRLVEAFLQSQSLSVRRTVEFITERATSAVIKDFQMLYLLPEKKAVTDRIAAVRAPTIQQVMLEIRTVCEDALRGVNGTWETHVLKMLNKRITDSFDALLPAETIDAVRTTCKSIALEKCAQKANEWRQSYMSDTELFCKNVQSEASTIMATQQRQAQQNSGAELAPPSNNNAALQISSDCAVLPSVLFKALQTLLRDALTAPATLTVAEVTRFLHDTQAFLEDPALAMTPTMHRMMAYMLLQLFLLLIKSRHDLVIPELVQLAVALWKHKKLAPYCLPPVPAQDVGNGSPTLSPTEEERSVTEPEEGGVNAVKSDRLDQARRLKSQQESNYVFSHLVSNRFVRMLEENVAPEANYASYATFINTVVEAGLVRFNGLTHQFLAIFNEEWPQATMKRISIVIDRVLHSSGKEELARRAQHDVDDTLAEMFMEMLSDFARDIEKF